MVDTEKRTDIHRPSAIQPENYAFVAMEHIRIDTFADIAFAAHEKKMLRLHMEQSGGQFSRHEHKGNCMICGAHCCYTAVFHHWKTNSYIRCGTICAEKMGIGDPDYFRTFRKACGEALKNRAGQAKAEALLKEKGLEKAWSIYRAEGSDYPQELIGSVAIIRDIVGKVVRYGNPTEPQLDFLRKLVDNIEYWPGIQAQRQKERESAEDCPEGRIEITGTILSVKEKEYDFYTRWVMTVKDDRGFLVWGTLPRTFGTEIRGAKVKFSAAVTPSDSDPKFGFYKRPTKAEVLKEEKLQEKK